MYNLIQGSIHRSANTRRPTALFLLVLLLSLGLMGMAPAQARRVIRVGVYENPPKIYTDSAGFAAGFWADLIREIAQRENLEIDWVRGSWEENLQRLERGEIDLMPDVGWTEARAAKYAFSAETVLTSWARVYIPAGSEIETIFDLEGKTVAGLEGSLNFDGPEGIRTLTQKFNIHSKFVGLPSYDAVFEALDKGEVDAGVANKDFGDLNENRYDVTRSQIIIQPTSLRFAFPKNGALTPWLAGVVDRDMKTLVDNPTSIYYQSLEKYFGQNIRQTFLDGIPAWVYELVILAVLAAAILLAATIIARRQIKRQTADLRASEARYRALVENNPDQIFRLNHEGVFLDHNGPAESELLISPTDFMGRNIKDVLPPDLAESILIRIQKAIETRELQSQEYSILWKDETREYEARYTACGNDEVTAVIREITDRKRAERDLRESQLRYQTLTDVAPVGIFHTDNEGRTTYVNPSWRQITDLPAEEAMGYGWLKAVHPEDRERLATDWQDAAQNQNSSMIEYRFMHADGTVVWVLGQAVPELDADNQPVGYVGTITDITERKKVEALQNAVLKAESADRLKSAFLATMSHELRTPLNSIIGFTGILLQKLVGPLAAEQEKQLAMIQGSAHHLLELINDVLDISKIEAGQLSVAAEDFDLATAIQKSVDKVRPMALKKGLALTTAIDPLSIEICSDRRRVEQILINLLNNGVKFTEQGEVRLECAVEGNWVTVRVVDTGIGIKPENVEVLFRPFQQVDSGLTRQYEGTGLGLSICKRLVELLGGRIWVESQPGLGSTFSFALPKNQPQEIDDSRN